MESCNSVNRPFSTDNIFHERCIMERAYVKNAKPNLNSHFHQFAIYEHDETMKTFSGLTFITFFFFYHRRYVVIHKSKRIIWNFSIKLFLTQINYGNDRCFRISFNVFITERDKEFIRTKRNETVLDCVLRWNFVKRKINKHRTTAVQRHLPITFERTKGTYTGCSVAQASHEGSYHESCLIAVKILNHAITRDFFSPRSLSRHGQIPRHRVRAALYNLKNFPQ